MKALLNLIPHSVVFTYDNTKYFTAEEVENISRMITVAGILFIVCAIILVTFILLFVFSRKSKITTKKRNSKFFKNQNGGGK